MSFSASCECDMLRQKLIFHSGIIYFPNLYTNHYVFIYGYVRQEKYKSDRADVHIHIARVTEDIHTFFN